MMAAEHEPGAASFVASNFSWAFVLEELDERTTRLILRSRIDAKPRQLFGLAYSLVVELPHFIMERKMLLGIKKRAESGQAARTGNSS